MKAAVHTSYGSPEVVQVMDVSKPFPKKNELLIQVLASTVNRTDCGFRSAEYFISRFFSGLLKPKHQILGNEFAGIVVATGEAVQSFQIGDKVFGYNDQTFGGHAEYLVIAESAAVATMPHGLNFQEAAPLTEGGHYALVDIRAAKVKPGQNVMVYGATGAIGSAAVQLLKCFGATVTAVCSTPHVSLVKSLGADTVIDYLTTDFTQCNQTFDFIFDAVGKTSFSACKPLLTAKGIYISTELGKRSANVFLALITPMLGGKKVLFPIPSISKADVIFLKELVEAGKFKPVIDKQYSLDKIVEAYHYVESRQKVGNVIINMQESFA
jgi:NADPH:quinone reductase-like Zn-dependent oxidoreductase